MRSQNIAAHQSSRASGGSPSRGGHRDPAAATHRSSRLPVDPARALPVPTDSAPAIAAGHDGLPWIKTLLLGLLMVVVIGAGFGIWYIFFRPGGPGRGRHRCTRHPGRRQPGRDGRCASSRQHRTGRAGGLAPWPSTSMGPGRSTRTIGSFDYAAGDFSGSWAGYRVQEQLVGIGGTTAVGRTPDITGDHHAGRHAAHRGEPVGGPDHPRQRPVDA